MKAIYTLIVFLFFSFYSQAQMVDSNTPSGALPTNTYLGSDWALDFSDEFEDATVNTAKWNIDNSTNSRNPRPAIGINRWFWRTRSVSLANGKLELNVEKTDWQTMVCGSINTNNKYETTYGYYEARIQIAETDHGTHTAFWLQGDNMVNGTPADDSGADGAEVDIFESAWLGDFTKAVVHIDGYGANKQASTKQYSTPGIHTGYHTYGFYWTKEYMRIYYDGVLKTTYKDPKYIPQVDEYLWLSDGASFGLGDEPDTDVFFVDRPIGDLTKAYVEYIRGWKSSKTNIAAGKTVTVSSERNGFPASNIVDGETVANESRWLTADAANGIGWAEIDLGGTYNVTGFRALSGFDGFNRPFQDYQFQYHNGTTWVDIVSINGETDAIVEQYFIGVTTDKVRLNITGNSEPFIRLYELEVYGESVLSVNDFNKKEMIIFPNPTTGEITFKDINQEVEANIMDVRGAVIKTQKTRYSIDLSSLPSGMYFVAIKGYKTEKVIKL
ncbi:family 16 glycosylhydrolase [uncultured Algibacter sp.]|uniref:family 16 glycosylhydrolase n=1 Tax=uncultured Algibacter sp. TaxID=298659 RepID=UPI002626F882|nr:family 16 glycosylhydrolase [uncultured Algibacter sp.]